MYSCSWDHSLKEWDVEVRTIRHFFLLSFLLLLFLLQLFGCPVCVSIGKCCRFNTAAMYRVR
jgi:hypothetical protein